MPRAGQVTALTPSVELTRCGTTCIVRAVGNVDVGVRSQLARRLHDVIVQRPEIVLIDLSDADFIDAAAARCVRDACRHAAAQSVRLLVVPAPEPVHQVFRVLGIHRELPLVGVSSGDEAPDLAGEWPVDDAA